MPGNDQDVCPVCHDKGGPGPLDPCPDCNRYGPLEDLPGDDQQEPRRWTLFKHPEGGWRVLGWWDEHNVELGRWPTVTVAPEQATRQSARAEALKEAAEKLRAEAKRVYQVPGVNEFFSYGIENAAGILDRLAIEEGRHSDG